MKRLGQLSAGVAALSVALSCGGEEGSSSSGPPARDPRLPWVAEPFEPVPFPEDNPPSEAKIALGRFLFFDPILSRDNATGCVTCHSELWGFSDGSKVSVGVDGVGEIGPGRDGPHRTTRNAPTLWNVAYQRELFADGRAASLEEQALFPLRNVDELALPPDEAVEKLRAIEAYQVLFEEAFPGESPAISVTTMAFALATFQRTLISDFAPYDHYVEGDEGALSESSIDGMWLFEEAGCAGCHVPPLFSSSRYVARFWSPDEGRAAISNDPIDRYAFRVPTLRNLRETEPYFHDGHAATLEEAVAEEAAISAARGEGRALSEDELVALSSFIRQGLMDRTGEPDRPDEVPSGLTVPRDAARTND